MRSHIDRQPFGDGAKIEQQRTKQRYCLTIGIEAHISIRCRTAALSEQSGRTSAAILTVEAAHLHRGTDRRIEGSPGLLSHRQRKPHRLVEDGACRNRDADRRREPRQFTRRIEPRAALFNLLKPAKSAPTAASSWADSRGSQGPTTSMVTRVPISGSVRR